MRSKGHKSNKLFNMRGGLDGWPSFFVCVGLFCVAGFGFTYGFFRKNIKRYNAELDILIEAVETNDAISDEDKDKYISEYETIRGKPNKEYMNKCDDGSFDHIKVVACGSDKYINTLANYANDLRTPWHICFILLCVCIVCGLFAWFKQ
jgi:hypothetical protein